MPQFPQRRAESCPQVSRRGETRQEGLPRINSSAQHLIRYALSRARQRSAQAGETDLTGPSCPCKGTPVSPGTSGEPMRQGCPAELHGGAEQGQSRDPAAPCYLPHSQLTPTVPAIDCFFSSHIQTDNCNNQIASRELQFQHTSRRN